MLNHQLESMAASCVGFVLMPDHMHALIWLPDPRLLSRFLHGWKRMSSFAIRAWYAEHAANYFADFGAGERFWQPKYYAFHIYSQQKLIYMHENPVRAGLIRRAIDWRWSSARWYQDRRSVGVPLTWID